MAAHIHSIGETESGVSPPARIVNAKLREKLLSLEPDESFVVGGWKTQKAVRYIIQDLRKTTDFRFATMLTNGDLRIWRTA